MSMNQTQRDYVVPAIAALVAVVAIVAGTVVGLALAGRDDAIVLVGVLGTIAVAPIIAALVPLIKSVNRAAVAQEATAEGVEKLQHRLNGEFSAEMSQALADAVAPLLAEISKINRRLEDGDTRFKQQADDVAKLRRQIEALEQQIVEMKSQIDQLVSCERKPE